MSPVDVLSTEVPLREIRAEGNIRQFLEDDDHARDLVRSIRSVGILQPVLLAKLPIAGGRPAKGHQYELVAGFRRYTAARQAGLKSVPARILSSLSAGQVAEIRLVENLQRLDMNPMEEARGLKEYIGRCDLTQEQAGEKVGRSGAWVSTRVRFLELPSRVQEMIEKGRLSPSNAIELLPYVGTTSESFLVRAAEVGCWRGSNQAFKSALEAGLPRSHPKKIEASTGCFCKCKCCLNFGHHLRGHRPPRVLAAEDLPVRVEVVPAEASDVVRALSMHFDGRSDLLVASQLRPIPLAEIRRWLSAAYRLMDYPRPKAGPDGRAVVAFAGLGEEGRLRVAGRILREIAA